MIRLIAASALLTIAGCGGGGSASNSAGNAGSVNNPPVISSPGDLSVAEGEITVTVISASDSNGDALNYSLSGNDSGIFTITNTGELRFRHEPDYSAPADSDQDNVYTFTITVTDGEATARLEVTVTVVKKLTDFEQDIFRSSELYQNSCGNPRTGTDPVDGSTYPDQPGSFADENNFLRAFSHEQYLWYDEIEDVNPETYAASAARVASYFNLMKTFETTSSGAERDQYHYAYDSAEYKNAYYSNIAFGYGANWHALQSAPPRKIVVAFVEPNSPASAAGLIRGAEIIAADGMDVVNGSDITALNNAFYPLKDGASHSFEVLDPNMSTPHTITMTATEVTRDPVQNVRVISTPSGPVGYFTFNDYIASAEQELIEAVTFLKDSNITDLVLDVRYNIGGSAETASRLAFMIAGPIATSGRTFVKYQSNDKLSDLPAQTPFHSQSFADEGAALPYLNLERVYVLTAKDTCSASEAIMNGLRGVDIEVIQVGSTTCGKPYGSLPQPNCGTTYLTIQFRALNDKGFGAYADGFSPSNLTSAEGEPVPGCAVDDDFSQPLGSVNEAMLHAALAYRDKPGTCPELAASLALSDHPILPNDLTSRSTAPSLDLLRPKMQRLPGMILGPTLAGTPSPPE